MRTERVDAIICCALAFAPPDMSGRRELGPLHLLNYVFLTDLHVARYKNGMSFTGANWQAWYYGPWSLDVYARVQEVPVRLGARLRQVKNPRSEVAVTRWNLVKPERYQAAVAQHLPGPLQNAIRRMVDTFGSETNAMLRYITARPTVRSTQRGAPIVFPSSNSG